MVYSNSEVFKNATLNEVIDDILVRFVVNLPREEQDTPDRIFFQIEEGSWFYEDFIRPSNSRLPVLSTRNFASRVFAQCPMIKRWDMDVGAAYDEWTKYKRIVPVRGAILLNETLDQFVVVRAMKGGSLSFPRGKINREETDENCAIREVYEETGFDIRGMVKPEDVIEGNSPGTQNIKLYVVPGVSMDTVFETKTRGEISAIHWLRLSEIPQYNTQGKSKYYMILPFIGKLKKWLGTKGKQWQRERNKRATSASLKPVEQNMTEIDGTYGEDQPQYAPQEQLQEHHQYDVEDAPLGGFFSETEPQALEEKSAELRSILGIGGTLGLSQQHSTDGQQQQQQYALFNQFSGESQQGQQIHQESNHQQSPSREFRVLDPPELQESTSSRPMLHSGPSFKSHDQHPSPFEQQSQQQPSQQNASQLSQSSFVQNSRQQSSQQQPTQLLQQQFGYQSFGQQQQHLPSQQQSQQQSFGHQPPQQSIQQSSQQSYGQQFQQQSSQHQSSQLLQQFGQQSFGQQPQQQPTQQQPSQLLRQTQPATNLEESFQLLSLLKNTKQSSASPSSILSAAPARAPERQSPFLSDQNLHQSTLLGQQRPSPLLSTSHQSGKGSFYMNQSAQASGGSLMHTSNISLRQSALPSTPDYMSSPALGSPKELTPQSLGLLHKLKSGSNPQGSSPTSSQVRPENQGLPSSASSYQTTFTTGLPSVGTSNAQSTLLLSTLRSGAPSTKSIPSTQQIPQQHPGMGFIQQQGSPSSVGSGSVNRGYAPQQSTPPSGVGVSDSHKAHLLAKLRPKSPLANPPLTNANVQYGTFQTPSPRNAALQSGGVSIPTANTASKRLSDPPSLFDTTFDKRNDTSKAHTDKLLNMFKAPSSADAPSLLGAHADAGNGGVSIGLGHGHRDTKPPAPSNIYGFGGLIRSSTFTESSPPQNNLQQPSPFSTISTTQRPLKRTNTMPQPPPQQQQKPATGVDDFLLLYLDRVAEEGARKA